MIASVLTVSRQVLILYFLMAVGYILGKAKMMDDRGNAALGNLLLYIICPCLQLYAFQRGLVREDLNDLALTFVGALVVVALSIGLGYLLLGRISRSRRSVFHYSLPFTNSGYMGYPLINAMYGSLGLFFGASYNAAVFFVLWSWGVYVWTGDRSRLRLKPILLNPNIIALVVALTLYLTEIRIPEILMTPITHLANMNTPLPMIIIGYQLSHADLKVVVFAKDFWFATFLRLILIPLCVVSLCLVLHIPAIVATVIVICASTPAGANTPIFAAKFGGDAALASGVVSMQTLLSILTLPVMVALVQTFLIS